MARTNKKGILKDVSGKIGALLIKQYKNKIVISKLPDMSGVEPSALQQKNQSIFAEASKYATAIKNNPVIKKQYEKKIKNGQDVFHYAIQEYYRKLNKGKKK